VHGGCGRVDQGCARLGEPGGGRRGGSRGVEAVVLCVLCLCHRVHHLWGADLRGGSRAGGEEIGRERGAKRLQGQLMFLSRLEPRYTQN